MTLVINESNLSVAWARLFRQVGRKGEGAVVLRIGEFAGELPPEDPALAGALNDTLKHEENRSTIEQTALTIFPFRQWTRRNRPNIREFTVFYLQEYYPRMRALNSKNARGTYFQRMVDYTGVTKSGLRAVNQLENVIEFWRRATKHGTSPRATATQVAIFDPAKDHTGSPLQVFPCLQQIGFTLDSSRQLEVHAFYPSQYIVERAYGNYRGLCHLGAFVAHEVGIRFGSLTCYVSHPIFGNVKKSELVHVEQHAMKLTEANNCVAND